MYLLVLLRRSKVEEQNRMSARNEVNHLTFNQDYTCVAIGSRNGFSIYNLDPIQVRRIDIKLKTDILIQLRYNNIGEGIGKIEMLYCTSLLALVGSGEQPGSSPRKFRLWNSQNKVRVKISLWWVYIIIFQEIICEITFASTILKMLMNRERLIVRLEGQIHVYDLATMKCLQVLTIAPSPSGVVALSAESSSYLAFPSGNAGGVVIYDCLTLRLVTQIDAHKNSIAALEFNR
jgi:autophagy-related protein 18